MNATDEVLAAYAAAVKVHAVKAAELDDAMGTTASALQAEEAAEEAAREAKDALCKARRVFEDAVRGAR